MKTLTVSKRIAIIRIVGCMLLLLVHYSSVAQDYRFRNPQRISGTHLSKGAVYRYSSVKSGTDALVRIANISSNTTLSDLDQDGDGYSDAFQPSVTVQGNREGYVEFEITFVDRNTSNPQVQSSITVSGVDIDGARSGNRPVHEFIGIDLGGGFVDYDLITGELAIENIGTLWMCRNITANDFSGIDTAERSVMFSALNNNVTTFRLRAGIINNSTSSQSRNASIYFGPFTYPRSALPVTPVVNFRGTETNNRINLEWQLTVPDRVHSCIIEKSIDGTQFNPVHELPIVPAGSIQAYNWSDPSTRISRVVYYRLKIVLRNGEITYSSVLPFPSQDNIGPLHVYPTHVTQLLNISFHAREEAVGYMEVSNLQGHIVYRQKLLLREGTNHFTAGPFGNLKPGIYAATIKTDREIHSRQIIIGVH